MYDVVHHKMPYVRINSYVYKMNHIFRHISFYCNTKGHTPNACYIGNYGEYVWVRKTKKSKRT